MDDYCKAAAVLTAAVFLLRWLPRGMLHSIYAVFPPPEITGHTGGKDSISEQKLEKGDGQWNYTKEILGFELNGEHRTGTLTEEKAEQ